MDYNQLMFSTYCIGCVAEALKMSQQVVYRLLKDSGILHSYIIAGYEVLHTFGKNYLVEDIVSYMREKGVLQ